ncbi:DUF3156 family protein [Leeia sp. TBRC 13508]|uniref:DUF3156 family protein n=1 Tax=Leeia speluncae TaxID=2884804 RepID=A0ABS8D9S6_9NEIS|nr:DUF3156 family protein [Leeia speluncae]MCB6184957.1 DUF3156 family protein [Leeia speluncae]
MSALSIVSQYFQPQTPRAYQAGATLRRVMLNLKGLHFEETSLSTANFSTTTSGICGTVAEKIDPLLFAHTVTTVFRFQIAPTSSAIFEWELGHLGAMRRQGVRINKKLAGSEAVEKLADQIRTDPLVLQHWLPLDAKTCRLIGNENGVYLEMEHFGGSEVVASFPNIRRYVRITPEQWQYALKVVREIKRIFA